MKILNISISDLEYKQLGINKDELSYTEFVDLINKILTKQNLSKSISLAEKYKLSKLSMDDISNEVNAVRNAKSNS